MHSVINKKKILLSLVCFALTVVLTGFVNVRSIQAYIYFLCFGIAFILFLDKKEAWAFTYAFIINAALTSIFVVIQCYVYPESYGTTSPFGSWTDDSYFFSLIADRIPLGLVTRDYFYEYTAFFSQTIRFVTPFRVYHPLDVIYFQSITAALLTIYSRQFAIQLTGDKKFANTVYIFCIVSPFLLMNGGAILLRDTLVAALFILSLCFINRKRYLIAAVAFSLQFLIRSGTGFIFAPLYFIFYYKEIKSFLFSRKKMAYSVSIIVGIAVGLYFGISYIIDNLSEILLTKGISFAGREVFDDLTATTGMNGIFLFIQNQNFLVKLILSGCYIFSYPFLNFTDFVNSEGIDVRYLLISVVYPIYSFWLNAWFLAAVFEKIKKIKKQKVLIVTFIVGFLLVGIFSLQSRHKTVFMPFYYFFVAAGFVYSSKKHRQIGYILSGIWLLAQLALSFRSLL